MIEINLIPLNLRKKANQGGFLQSIDLPKEILFGLGSMALILLVLIHVCLLGLYVVKLSQHFIYTSTWQRMLPEKKNIDSISQELKDLKAKMSTITDLTAKRSALWSQKLNILSDAMPKGLWLRKINWDNTALIIEGSAYSKFHDEITTVGTYVSNIK